MKVARVARYIRGFFWSLLILTFLSGCSQPGSQSIFSRLEVSQTHVDFVNAIQETEKDNVLNYEYFYNGGGTAAADFNNDGLIDLYFTANQGSDKLYLNEGKLSFKDITQQAGIDWKGEWKTGVTIVDINNDGWQDIYVSVSGNVDNPGLRRNKLYINNKNLTFTDRAAGYGLDLPTFTTQTAFFDYDNDGDLDAYLLNHNIKDFKRFDADAVHAMRDSLAGDRLMRNNGPGQKFTDVSKQAGIKGNPIGFGLGIHTADINNDGWMDMYISNDYIEADYLYLNNKNGSFTDVVKSSTGHVSYFSMGNDVGDINNDLLPDIITMDMLPEDNKRQKLLFGPEKYEAYLSMLRNGFHPEVMRNMVQLNMGAEGVGRGGDKKRITNSSYVAPCPHFSEIGQLAGVSNTDWSWSALLADYDNDGFNDLFITNGYLRDYTNNDFVKYYASQGQQANQSILELISRMPSTKTPNYIFRNEHDLTFSNKQTDWGFDTPVISNGAVYADLDNDGDLELVTNNINEPAFIYQNLSTEQAKNNYLTLVLNPGKAGILATGTKVFLYCDSLKQYRQFTPTHGFQSSLMIPLNFGMATHKTVDSLVIVWPTGDTQTLRNVAANRRLTISYAPDAPARQPESLSVAPLFTRTNTLDFTHQQAALNDFSRQILLPHMYSYAGPRMAKADVNKDGREDIYIGGGKGQPGAVWLQQPNGQFTPTNQPAFTSDALSTDTDAAFLDADNDGDVDLYVTSGGYEYLATDLLLQNRLYLNDGRGKFTKETNRLDASDFAGNAVTVLDFDRDNDPDLFVCGSVIPGQYPNAQPSRLYRNDNGRFVSVASDAFANLGLLTDAVAVDIDKDGFQDIVAVGEWTPIIRLQNKKGVFSRMPDDPDQLTGFWQRIAASDVDRDGDMDLIVGNYGLNTQFRALVAQPLTLQTADFDDNGTLDPIMSYFIQGKKYPAYSRDELLDQLAPLRKKYTSYALYSDATTDDILANFAAKTPETRAVTELATVLLINNGGTFDRRALPVQAQFSPIYAIATPDLNNDGFADLVLAGNQSRGRVRTGNVDANYGQIFLNDQKGGFSYMPQPVSGLWLHNDVRSILFVGNQLVVGINSGKIQTYTWRK